MWFTRWKLHHNVNLSSFQYNEKAHNLLSESASSPQCSFSLLSQWMNVQLHAQLLASLVSRCSRMTCYILVREMWQDGVCPCCLLPARRNRGEEPDEWSQTMSQEELHEDDWTTRQKSPASSCCGAALATPGSSRLDCEMREINSSLEATVTAARLTEHNLHSPIWLLLLMRSSASPEAILQNSRQDEEGN